MRERVRERGAAPAGMEHVNGASGVTPPYLLNGASAGPAASALTGAPAHRLEAAFAVCSAAGMPVSAATLAGVPVSAGVPVTPAGLPATPAGLSVTPTGPPAVPAGPAVGPPMGPALGPQAGPPTSGRQSVPALSRSPLLAGPPLPAAGVVFSRNRYGQGKYPAERPPRCPDEARRHSVCRLNARIINSSVY